MSETINVGTGAKFTSITSALEAAKPGDTIEISEGVYEERLCIHKELTVRGSGKVVFRHAESSPCVIHASCHLSNLRFERIADVKGDDLQAVVQQTYEEGIWGVGLGGEGVVGRLTDCVIDGGPGLGCYVVQGGTLNLTDCTIDSAGYGAVRLDGGHGEFVGSHFRGPCEYLLFVTGDARLTMTDCDVSGTLGTGLTVSGGASAKVSGGQLREHKYSGAQVDGEGSSLTVDDTEVALNGENGFMVFQGANLNATNCRVHGNGLSGFSIMRESKASVSSSQLNDNGENGLLVTENSHLELVDSFVRGHSGEDAAGVVAGVLADVGASAVIKRCEISGNIRGVALYENARGVLSENQIADNARSDLTADTSSTVVENAGIEVPIPIPELKGGVNWD